MGMTKLTGWIIAGVLLVAVCGSKDEKAKEEPAEKVAKQTAPANPATPAAPPPVAKPTSPSPAGAPLLKGTYRLDAFTTKGKRSNLFDMLEESWGRGRGTRARDQLVYARMGFTFDGSDVVYSSDMVFGERGKMKWCTAEGKTAVQWGGKGFTVLASVRTRADGGLATVSSSGVNTRTNSVGCNANLEKGDFVVAPVGPGKVDLLSKHPKTGEAIRLHLVRDQADPKLKERAMAAAKKS